MTTDHDKLNVVGPCTNCAKKGRKCTFEWLRSAQEVVLSTRSQQQSHHGRRDSAIFVPSESPIFPLDFALDTFQPAFANDFPPPVDNMSVLLPSSAEELKFPCAQPIANILQLQGNENRQVAWGNGVEGSMAEAEYRLGSAVKGSVVPSYTYGLGSKTYVEGDNEETHVAKRARARRKRSFASQFCPGSETPLSPGSSRRPLLRQQSSYTTNASSTLMGPSPDVFEGLAWSTNRSLLTESLVRIYRDSMENALSCWLTERTCPYGVSKPPLLQGSGSGLSTPISIVNDEWGPQWTNRICTRVCRLDSAKAIRDRPLTRSEDKAASRALHAAIMSFATQWAQSNGRSATEFSSFMAAEDGFGHMPATSSSSDDRRESSQNNLSDHTSPSPLDFERSMQETFWHQARQALQETAEIESFRVIFAHIIFSLTQRPLSERLPLQNSFANGSSPTTSKNGATVPGLTELDLIIESEGPPLFLETAMRQLFSYRCKLERIDRQRAVQMAEREGSDGAGSGPSQADPLSVGDRKTFNLLFWLGVMFDTLSSAMHRRPLVVSDEDSDILPEPPQDLFPPASDEPPMSYPPIFTKDGESTLWGQFFLQERRFRHSQHVARWPCALEDAASTLCDAAPVKVLLFRKVTHLQTLLSRRARHEKLEEAIQDALQVYQYWNDTYGHFILDCVANHDDLPPRIQSWYVVLAGHWHLAGLLLADMVEAVDKTQMGREAHRLFRQSSRLVWKLRRQNAYAVADLGRCSSPRFDSSFPKGPEFHFAVNKGALLTEPWTVVLIRSFGKAGYILLDSIPSDGQRGQNKVEEDVESSEAEIQCGFCVRALWYLGRKSDMAFLVATALSNALKNKIKTRNAAVPPPLTEPTLAPVTQQSDTEFLGQYFSPNLLDDETFPFSFSPVSG
ncbi:hypothetical protein LTR16_000435 [Cryomyces antarcticus]|uniref:Transcription factor domain-containing protein n=1 Tax=Cryomyces antarcticus TaxID=329879 RepID=A0ABR0LQY1_9PEZI|nr:hypothetical protein LTR39_000315 [Cryomyces antarcticus]KAK5021015.1 hypothetical protein LTR60_000149 [Cryomyces antarcticus]KAK5202083.1 hypothetical protein LTR16_000435 [Cryomyces antarcticus]